MSITSEYDWDTSSLEYFRGSVLHIHERQERERTAKQYGDIRKARFGAFREDTRRLAAECQTVQHTRRAEKETVSCRECASEDR